MSPADLPPPDLPRLFVGGLPPTLATSAVIRLLSKFVQPHTVHRHPTRPFAHISVSATDEDSLTRCIAALNNTTWCGTTLRVQKAVPHYWFRLKQQWELQTPIQTEPDTILELSYREENSKKKSQHFETLPKGKHIVFDFPDLEHTDVSIAYDDEIEIHTSHENRFESHQVVHSNTNDHHSPIIANSTSKLGPSKSTSLSSTMALFGLCTPSAPTPTAAPSKEQKRNPHRDHPERPGAPPPKRPRISAEDNAQDSDRAAVQGGEDQVDLSEEKETALAVLRNMFPTDISEGRPTEEIIAQNRRLALFRKLPVTSTTQQYRNQGSNFGKRKPRQRLAPSSRTEPPSKRQDGPTQESRLRRAGLYKRLASATGNATIAPDELPNYDN